MQNCRTWYFNFHSSITLPIGTCMAPNLQKFKLKENTETFNSISKLITSTNTPHLSQETFWALQFQMHWCTLLCTCLCWQSYIIRGKSSHVWKGVGWCQSTCAQVGGTHLPSATHFLNLQGLTQVHQPLQTLAIANDFQVWDLEHISEVVWQLKTIFRGFRHHIISNPSLHLICLKVDFFGSHQSFWHKFQQ